MLWQERIESLKTGLLGAIAAGLTAVFFSLIEAVALSEALRSSLPQGGRLIGPLPLQSLDWAIAALSGFLFAVTYRYVIRQDPSSHLRSGAVLAFGLVRGLAQVEIALEQSGDFRLLLLLLGESLVMMAIARVILDQGLRRGWLQPFKGFEVAP
jgi:hypothetical protein